MKKAALDINRSDYFCAGPFFKKIFKFALPVALAGILQLLYNTVDIIIIGQFSDSASLAAVTSTNALVNLVVTLFTGFSIGASAAIAQSYGAKDMEKVSRLSHTAMWLGIISGLTVGVIGVTFCRDFLYLMGSPEDVIDMSTEYLTIYFAGMPLNMVYTFGSAILRGAGDTKRPFYYMLFAGITNVGLDIWFVAKLGWNVAGVAIATVAAQGVSAILIVISLKRETSSLNIDAKKLRPSVNELIEIVKLGFPAGMQGAIFALSNVIIQSSVNTFGSPTMAGNGAAQNIESYVWTAMNSVYSAALTFTGQNYGAKKKENFNKILFNCLLLVVIVGLSLGVSAYLLGKPLLSVYSSGADREAVVAIGRGRMMIICTTYFICGIMDVLVGQMRGLGYSTVPMLLSIVCVCALRVLWVFTVFEKFKNLVLLYVSYPVSWTLAVIALVVSYIIIYNKVSKKIDGEIIKPKADAAGTIRATQNQ